MHALAGKPPRENSQFPAGFLKSVQTQPCFRLPNVLKRNEQNPARRHAAGRITLGIPGRDLPYTERPRSSMALSNLVHPSFLPRFDFHLRRQTMAPFETSSLPNTRPFLRTRNSISACPSCRGGSANFTVCAIPTPHSDQCAGEASPVRRISLHDRAGRMVLTRTIASLRSSQQLLRAVRRGPV